MRTTVLAHGGMTTSLKCLFLLITLALLVAPASADIRKNFDVEGDMAIINQSYHLDNQGATPFVVWSGCILLGIVLVILSFMSGLFPNGEEGLVSILAWIPITYATYTAFAVDMMYGFGATSQIHSVGATQATYYEYVLMENHAVYHFDGIAVCLFIFLVFAVGNTYRIWLSQNKIRQLTQPDQEVH